MSSDRDHLWVIFGFILFLMLVIGGYFVVHNHLEARCASHGGHLVTLYKSYLCVDAEGRILEY